jgi:hypothetical protein
VSHDILKFDVSQKTGPYLCSETLTLDVKREDEFGMLSWPKKEIDFEVKLWTDCRVDVRVGKRSFEIRRVVEGLHNHRREGGA